jgi:hypothetical protein
MNIALNTSGGGNPVSNYLRITVRKTPLATGVIADTSFTVTLSGAETSKSFYNASVNFAAGDSLSTQLTIATAGGGGASLATDCSIQLDLF